MTSPLRVVVVASLVALTACASARPPSAVSTNAAATPEVIVASASNLRLELAISPGDAKKAVEETYAGEELVRVAPSTPPKRPPGSDDAPTLPHERESWRYPALGVWFFFDGEDRVATIRLDAPFAGAVGGVRIGETAQQLTVKRGAPQKTWSFGANTAVSYDAGTPNWTRYDVDPDGVIVIMFR